MNPRPPGAPRRDPAACTDEPHAFTGQRETEKLQLKIGGMSCSFCVASITRALTRMEGVREAAVNLAHEEALVTYDPRVVTPTQLKETLLDLGYTVRDASKVRTFEEEEAELRRERANLLVAAGFALAAVSPMLLMWLGWLPLPQAQPWLIWLMPTLALSTVFGPGWHILTMAWASLRRGILNQHVLLEFGAFAGLLGGFLSYILADWPLVDFFAVAVFVTTYHLLSGYVSLLVRTRASQAVRKLLALVPPTARVVRDGREAEVPIEQVHAGDLVRIRPGESIPADGEVVEGASAVDESLVTGESIPEEKTPGDAVIGGSINQTGTLLVRVTRVGEESFLQQVARQVEEARALKPGILALVDRILRVYVPGVLAFAGAAILIWTLGAWLVTGSPDWTRAVFAALAVLVMGYPCALGMATPLAMIRGGGMAAERGILMRSAEAFQVLKDVRKVVLDKTGTITRGEPAVAEVVALAGQDTSEALRLAAAAEASSEHPLARAVVAAAEARHLPVPKAEEFRATPGKGVTARVEGRRIAVGSPRFLEDEGVDLEPARAQVEAMQAAGRTVVAVAVDGKPAALIAIADQLKADAVEAVERLRAEGLEPVMLTGDNARTGAAIGRALGLDVQAGLLPDDKLRVIEAMKVGGPVVMVGDGINDAPALAAASVGVAMGGGTDVALETADAALLKERVTGVAELVALSRTTLANIRQNVAIALGLKAVFLVTTMAGITGLWPAILADTGATVLVTLNALRLLRWRPRFAHQEATR